jgi:hypothetical protein
MGQIKFIGSFMMIMVFTIAVIGFAGEFGEGNDVAIKLSDPGAGNLSQLGSDLKNEIIISVDQINDSSQSFMSPDNSIAPGSESTETGGIFKKISSAVFTGFSSVSGGIKAIFITSTTLLEGSDGSGAVSVGLTALLSFLVIVALLLIWKTWAGKNPD